MDNYYKILGIKDFSSLDEIKTAYKKLAMKFHPDVNDGDKFFEEKFKELQNADEVLSDTSRRNSYDEKPKISLSNTNFKVSHKERKTVPANRSKK